MIEPAIRRVVTLVAVFLFATTAARAQTVGASLQGIVTDPTGSALPNADVVVLSTATGGVWEMKTDASGRYRVPVLQPGEYEVHVSQTGFQPVVRRGIQLAVGQNAVIDVKLGPAGQPIFGAGGHAMLIAGYDRRAGHTPYFIVKNSWDTSYGHNGYLWISYDYIRTYAKYGYSTADLKQGKVESLP